MDIKEYRNKIIAVLEDYVEGKITGMEASNYALYILRSTDWEKFPVSLRKAVHLLFDLHDTDETWCPATEEIIKCKSKLEKEI